MTIRPALSEKLGKPSDANRQFFVDALKQLEGIEIDKLKQSTRPAQVIYAAAGLAEWDKHVTRQLSPETDKALNLMFSIQNNQGTWGTLDCWPPYESDAFHEATVAAMAVAAAPDWCGKGDCRHLAVALALPHWIAVGVTAWAHAPVAAWTGLACVLILLWRLAAGPNRRALIRAGTLALAVFTLVVVGYAARLTAVMEPAPNQHAAIRQLMDSLRSVLPGVFQPVSATATKLSDFQLGYGMWLLLVVTLVTATVRTGASCRPALFAFATLGLLVFPVPAVTEHLWRGLPESLVIANDAWPSQRLYLVLAALVALGSTAAFGARKGAISGLLGYLWFRLRKPF